MEQVDELVLLEQGREEVRRIDQNGLDDRAVPQGQYWRTVAVTDGHAAARELGSVQVDVDADHVDGDIHPAEDVDSAAGPESFVVMDGAAGNVRRRDIGIDEDPTPVRGLIVEDVSVHDVHSPAQGGNRAAVTRAHDNDVHAGDLRSGDRLFDQGLYGP